MDNKQILERAIQKAIDGGWRDDLLVNYAILSGSGTPEKLIFNHNFAKALWPRPDVCNDCGRPLDEPHRANNPNIAEGRLPHSYTIAEWRFHLQQMVIADDPVKYLGENI